MIRTSKHQIAVVLVITTLFFSLTQEAQASGYRSAAFVFKKFGQCYVKYAKIAVPSFAVLGGISGMKGMGYVLHPDELPRDQRIKMVVAGSVVGATFGALLPFVVVYDAVEALGEGLRKCDTSQFCTPSESDENDSDRDSSESPKVIQDIEEISYCIPVQDVSDDSNYPGESS